MAVNWTNVTDFADFPSLANDASGGTFWAGILQMVWVVILLLGMGYGLEIALLFSAFIGLILALFLAYSGLVAFGFVVQFAAIILVTILYIIYSSDGK